MPLINAEPFTGAIEGYRMVWIAGKTGGHKTSLAYKLAEPFLASGYKLLSNNKNVWMDDPKDITLDKNGLLKLVVIMDEGGLYFKSGRQVEMIASYPAKMDCLYFFPSYWPPTRAAQALVCQAMYSLKSTGLPIIVYRWRAKLGAFDDKGFFIWWDPSEIYGIYSRRDPGASPESIIEFLIKKTEEYRKFYGHENNEFLSALEESSQPYDQLREAVADFSEAADTLSSISFRGNRKRR